VSRGRIEKALSGFYYVNTGTATLACRARGKFRKEGISPLVGDWVEVQELDGETGFVEAIEPRRNAFARPAVANIDQLVLIASEAIPVSDPYLLDRLCAIAELKDCGVVICVNKCDLKSGEALAKIYEQVGYPTLCISAETGEGIEQLRARLTGKLSVFTGNSGVGKSSILNRLHPDFAIAAAAVSEKLGRGRHTTRHVELFHLDEDTLVADTPGFSSFDTTEMDLELKAALPECFRDFRPYLDFCRFVGCSHTREKGCAVLEAVNRGDIASSRHESYLRLYEELKDLREWNAHSKK
jgi:ribosome biogenesis GTPase